jgi:hypothetical protein
LRRPLACRRSIASNRADGPDNLARPGDEQPQIVTRIPTAMTRVGNFLRKITICVNCLSLERTRGQDLRTENCDRRGAAAHMSLSEEKTPGGSAQAVEKARFGKENPRKSKLFSLIFFAQALPGLAGFGQIWL